MFSARLLPVAAITAADWERCLPGEAEGHAYYAACEAIPPQGFVLSAIAVFAELNPSPHPSWGEGGRRADEGRLNFAPFSHGPPIASVPAAPHPPLGHLLPVKDGEKGFSGEIVALCPVFRLDYNLATALQGTMRRVADGFSRLFPRALRLSVIGLGSPLGERCHIGFAPELDTAARQEALRVMLAALGEAARAQQIGMVAVKDLAEPDDAVLRDMMRAQGFTPVNSLPIAVLKIPAGGEDGYISTLSAGMRKDLRRKLKKSSAVQIERHDSIMGLEDDITALYQATQADSDLDYGEFEELPPGYFARIMAALGPRAFLMLYRVGGELAAFNLLFQDDFRLIDKFWGMKRGMARKHDLYFISWMTNVKMCQAAKIPLLQTGQTAYALKLRLGSHLVPGHVWFRHQNFVVDRMLRMLARIIAFDEMDPDLKALRKKAKNP